jgi:hypothetical protein
MATFLIPVSLVIPVVVGRFVRVGQEMHWINQIYVFRFVLLFA